MPADPSFDELMARLRAGDNDAAAEVFHRFANRLIALVRTRLDHRMRQKIDPEDVLQSAFKSFFLRHAEGQFSVGDWDSLWSLLVVLTLRKCGHRIGYFRAARRDVRAEVPPPAAEEAGTEWQALSRDPTAAEVAMLGELVEQLMQPLEGRERDILSLSLQGYAAAEIGAQVQCSEHSVRRVLERVRKRLQRLQAAENSPPPGSPAPPG